MLSRRFAAPSALVTIAVLCAGGATFAADAGAPPVAVPSAASAARTTRTDAASPAVTAAATPDAGAAGPGTAQAGAPTNPHADPHGSGTDPTDPHSGGGGGGGGGDGLMPRMPADQVVEDPALPANVIDVEIRDGDDKPRAGVPVVLGIVQNSVAKGESRDRKAGVTDPSGHVRWAGLEGGSQMAYRVSVTEGGGQFAARPFQLDPTKGMRVVLHTYPTTSDISQAMVVMQSIVYVDLKDDRIQVQQAFNIYNFGKSAWVPRELVLPLPSSYTALTAQPSMSDQVVEGVAGQGARIRGTFGPGQHALEYRWQLPFSGESSIDLDIGMPPNVAASRVMVVSAGTMKASVEGFPALRPNRDGQGNAILETEREMRRDEAPLRNLRVVLTDIPGPGPLRLVFAGLAAFGVLLGVSFHSRSNAPTSDRKDKARMREQLLADLEELELAKRRGDVGPRTYERARRVLVDALARLLASESSAS